MTSIFKHIYLASLALSPVASAQWTVINLHPAGAARSFAYGADKNQQAGIATFNNQDHAGLWQGTATSHVDLHPAGADYSAVYGIGHGQQVGYAGQAGSSIASLWSGTAASWTNLAPEGSGATINLAASANAGQQVGVVDVDTLRASLWSGSAESWIDLTPLGFTDSFAYCTRYGSQVGSADSRASLWQGTAASHVDLHPSAATAYSEAVGISAGQQVGYARVGDHEHASLWRGSAASWVDLAPAGSTDSYCLGACAGQQVGNAYFNGASRAVLWTGSADSWLNLDSFLAPQYGDSYATAISRDAQAVYVAGYAFNIPANRFEALLWKKPITCNADFDQDGFLTGADFDLYVAAFEAGDEIADVDGDGFVTGIDFDGYVQTFESGC